MYIVVSDTNNIYCKNLLSYDNAVKRIKELETQKNNCFNKYKYKFRIEYYICEKQYFMSASILTISLIANAWFYLYS